VDKATATLVAAIIAATASLIVLWFRTNHERQVELRVAHRRSLEPYIEDLGESLHQIVASSNILLKPLKEKQRAKWTERARTAQNQLRMLRPKVRYSLWGLDEGIRAICRLPDWVARRGATAANSKALVTSATRLREALDLAINASFRDGRQPSLFARLRLSWSINRFRQTWGQTRDAMFEELTKEDIGAETVDMSQQDAVPSTEQS
jgi:hypothetical protein